MGFFHSMQSSLHWWQVHCDDSTSGYCGRLSTVCPWDRHQKVKDHKGENSTQKEERQRREHHTNERPKGREQHTKKGRQSKHSTQKEEPQRREQHTKERPRRRKQHTKEGPQRREHHTKERPKGENSVASYMVMLLTTRSSHVTHGLIRLWLGGIWLSTKSSKASAIAGGCSNKPFHIQWHDDTQGPGSGECNGGSAIRFF